MSQHKNPSRFLLIDHSRSFTVELRSLYDTVKRHDPDLAKQLRRAAASIHLNIREGQHSQGRRQQARYFDAMGSANEVRGVIEFATDFGYIKGHTAEAKLDRVIAILWKLTR